MVMHGRMAKTLVRGADLSEAENSGDAWENGEDIGQRGILIRGRK